MDHDLIRKVFRRDYQGLLGFDLYEIYEDLQFVTHGWFKQFPDLFTLSFEKLAITIGRLTEEYLDFNPERFPNPLDQYVWIYECRDNVMKIVDELKVAKPSDDPALYLM